jgi:type II secretory pathway pseudopilin PulG
MVMPALAPLIRGVPRSGGGFTRSDGFTYLTVLIIVAMMGVGLALAGHVWQTMTLREREADLLHVGNEYRKAIERYYISGPRQYPRELKDLLKDPRQAGTVRYLRKLYPDPVTGKDEWGVVKAPDGGIAGVFSTSEAKPLKSGGFAVRDKEFEGTEKYSDWKFSYAPAVGAAPGSPAPAGSAAPGSPAPAAGSPTPSAGSPGLNPAAGPTTIRR